MRTHMSCLVDNTRVSNSFMHMMSTTQELALEFKHMVSTTCLYKIHFVILILSLMYIHSCTMEDNPLLVDTFLVVILISLLILETF